MRWRGRRQSSNVEDRRGRSMIRSKRGARGGVAVLLILAGIFFGQDVQKILSLFVGTQNQQTQQQPASQTTQASNDEAAQFVRTILAETEDTWTAVFAQSGQRYEAPKLVLYDGQVSSACGQASAASGPFYCPGDYQIYIDLSFLNDLKQMGASGDFAFAYVIAHEVGHHVQNIVGIAKGVRQLQASSSKAEGNALSVKMELQADCFAGIWINHTEKRSAILEAGDIEEGINAAEAVADDTIMRKAGRAPRRENFSHGSSEERIKWFIQGMSSGDIQACQTFA
jgi:predicted metalloprotease